MKMNADFGIKACYEAVVLDIEVFHKDPIRMLGKYTLRAKQDMFFNNTMIDVLMMYIEEHGIKWND